MTPIGPKNRAPDHGVGEPGLPQPRRLHACGRGKSLLLPGRGVKGRRVSLQASRCSSGRSAGLRPSDARRARYRGSACSHSRQATERLSDNRRAREPAPVAGLRPPQERLKLRLWHPGSRLESRRRVALPAFCDTFGSGAGLYRCMSAAVRGCYYQRLSRSSNRLRTRLRLRRCLGRPSGGAMPLPEPCCAQGWGIGALGHCPKESARRSSSLPSNQALYP